jgi:hypothetical protein
MRTSRTWRVALAVLLILPLAGACKKKGPRPGEGAGAGLGEEGLGASGSSLERSKRGLAPAKIELEGHCDSRGTIEYNLALGAKRAKAVKDHLVGQGIAAERISSISYGKELPLCHEENDACWARNRRVHSVILGQ